MGLAAGRATCLPQAHSGLRLFLGAGVYPKQMWCVLRPAGVGTGHSRAGEGGGPSGPPPRQAGCDWGGMSGIRGERLQAAIWSSLGSAANSFLGTSVYPSVKGGHAPWADSPTVGNLTLGVNSAENLT